MTKIKVLTVLTLVFVLLLSSLVFADITVDNNDLVIDVSYKNLVDNDDEIDVSYSITVTNTGNTTENVAISLENVDSDYDLTLSDNNLVISAGGNSDVSITGKSPVDQDAGEHTIATLKVNSVSYNLKTNVQNMLEVKKIEFHVNGKSEKNVDNDNEEVDELEPGDEIELIFELKNLFDEDYNDGDIEGTITVQLDDSDFGDDIDEEEDFKIKAGETIDSDDEELVIKFVIPDDVDEGEYTLEVTIEGEDDTGAEYKTEWDINLVVERDENDFRIVEATLSPTELSCSKTSMLTIKVKNFGTNRQKHAALSIFNSQLGINENFPFEIGRGTSNDNTYLHQYLIKLDEANIGKYPLSVNVLYDYTTFSDKELVDLVVEKCISSDVVEDVEQKDEDNLDTTSSNDNVDEKAPENKNKISSNSIIKTIEDSYNKQDLMIALLLVTMLLVFGLVILLTVVLFKK